MTVIVWLFYVVFVALILGFFFWSTLVLQRQKKAWHNFAKKHDLVYHKAPFMQASAVDGNYKGYRIGLFSEGKADERRRGFIRYRSIIEVIFGESMPITAAMGNTEAAQVIHYLNFGTNHIPENPPPEWQKNHLITASNHDFIREYLTPERLKGLNSFFNIKGVVAMYVFNETDSFLRLETANPLIDHQKMERLIDKMIALSNKLKASDSEKRRLIEKVRNMQLKAEEELRAEESLPPERTTGQEETTSSDTVTEPIVEDHKLDQKAEINSPETDKPRK